MCRPNSAMARAAFLCLALVGLAAVTSARAGSQGSLGSQTSGQDPAVLARAFGIHFGPRPVANGAAPTLPDGRAGVRSVDAISVAMQHAPAGVNYSGHTVLAGVQVTAQYGTFSDSNYGSRLPSGELHAYYQNRPAWVVTFSGPGVMILPHGPAPKGATHHEVSVVVDASTGQYMLGYSYR